jgi:hypothetical protein
MGFFSGLKKVFKSVSRAVKKVTKSIGKLAKKVAKGLKKVAKKISSNKYLGPLASIAIGYFVPALGTGIWGAMAKGALTGFITSGGNIKGALLGGAMGGLGYGMSRGVESFKAGFNENSGLSFTERLGKGFASLGDGISDGTQRVFESAKEFITTGDTGKLNYLGDKIPGILESKTIGKSYSAGEGYQYRVPEQWGDKGTIGKSYSAGEGYQYNVPEQWGAKAAPTGSYQELADKGGWNYKDLVPKEQYLGREAMDALPNRGSLPEPAWRTTVGEEVVNNVTRNNWKTMSPKSQLMMQQNAEFGVEETMDMAEELGYTRKAGKDYYTQARTQARNLAARGMGKPEVMAEIGDYMEASDVGLGQGSQLWEQTGGGDKAASFDWEFNSKLGQYDYTGEGLEHTAISAGRGSTANVKSGTSILDSLGNFFKPTDAKGTAVAGWSPDTSAIDKGEGGGTKSIGRMGGGNDSWYQAASGVRTAEELQELNKQAFSFGRA